MTWGSRHGTRVLTHPPIKTFISGRFWVSAEAWRGVFEHSGERLWSLGARASQGDPGEFSRPAEVFRWTMLWEFTQMTWGYIMIYIIIYIYIWWVWHVTKIEPTQNISGYYLDICGGFSKAGVWNHGIPTIYGHFTLLPHGAQWR